jgi:hypothetical protein
MRGMARSTFRGQSRFELERLSFHACRKEDRTNELFKFACTIRGRIADEPIQTMGESRARTLPCPRCQLKGHHPCSYLARGFRPYCPPRSTSTSASLFAPLPTQRRAQADYLGSIRPAPAPRPRNPDAPARAPPGMTTNALVYTEKLSRKIFASFRPPSFIEMIIPSYANSKRDTSARACLLAPTVDDLLIV